MKKSGDEEGKGCSHKWSLQKDPEFMEDYDSIIKYLATAHAESPCPHTELPISMVSSTVASAFLDNIPEMFMPAPLRSMVGTMLQRITIEAFYAGVQLTLDGNRLGSYEAFEVEDLVEDDEDYNPDEELKSLREAREAFRDHYYRPQDGGLDLEKIKEMIEKHTGSGGEVKVINGSSLPPQIRRQLLGMMESGGESGDGEAPVGWGGYL